MFLTYNDLRLRVGPHEIAISVREDGKIFIGDKEKRASDNGNGYKSVHFSVLGTRKRFYVHRLVARAFIGKLGGGKEINHIDFNRSNNNVKNLEIVSREYNRIWTMENGRGKRDLKYSQFEIILGLHFSDKMPVYKITKLTGLSRDMVRGAISGKLYRDYRDYYIEKGNEFKIKEFKIKYRGRNQYE